MKSVKYAKYNRERVPKFQVSTILYEEDGNAYAQKVALHPEAEAHIKAFGTNYEKLKDSFNKIEYVRPEYIGEGVSFAFIEGESVAKKIEHSLNDYDELVVKIREAFEIMFDYRDGFVRPFEETEAFRSVFYQVPARLSEKPAVPVANLDMIFDNFVEKDGKWYCIDYEWILDFPVPVEFIRYRVLFYFYHRHVDLLANDTDQTEFMEQFGIDRNDQAIYENMENIFQEYVHGTNREYIYLKNYGKAGIPFEEYMEGRQGGGLFVRRENDELHRQIGQISHELQVYRKYVEEHQRARKNPIYAARLAGRKAKRGIKKVGRKAYPACKDAAKKVLPEKVYKAAMILKNQGKDGLRYAMEARKHGANAMYVMWMKENEQDLQKITPLEYQPLISVVVPVYNVDTTMLTEMIESVRTQTYTNWELVLVDDCSTQESVRTTLARYEGKEKIKVIYREENGHISKATNTGFEAATGEFVGLLDCDDLLAPNALYEVARLLNAHPEYDFIYSDEDKISEDGTERRDPFFKPDWSPDTFMSYMYTCHFSVYRMQLIRELGGMRVGLEGSQDYDLVLRVMEHTGHIGHIPKILYHWRMRKESTANDLTAKPYIIESTIKAKEDALERRGIKGTISCIEEITQFRVTYEPVGNPKISIIIPSKDNYDILKQCLDSIDEVSEYRNYEIIVVDNGSNAENQNRYRQLIEGYHGTYHYAPMEFNFSRMCNIGASLAKGNLFLFLNDDIKITEPKWLDIMAGQAIQKHTGAVGCKLLYPNTNLIQHAGVVNYAIGPGHAFHKFDDSLNLYWGRNMLDYNYSVVTGACLMVDAKKYREIKGFEETLPVAYNDVDLCFKLVEHGYFNVLRNDVTLYHYESISRGADVAPEKAARLKREAEHLYLMHPDFVDYDPCYNPNLVPDRGDFSFNLHGAAKVAEPDREYSFYDKKRDEAAIRYSIDRVGESRENILITGWAMLSKKLGTKADVRVVLINAQNEMIAYQAQHAIREDLAVFGKKAIECGFKCKIARTDLRPGTYRIALELNGRYVLTENHV